MMKPTDYPAGSASLRLVFLAIVFLLGALLSGCSTLSSFGIGTGNSSNRILTSAKQISGSQGHAQAIPKELSESVLPTYIVEPGDVLLIEPAKFDSPVRLPGDQSVQPDGMINLGQYGRMHVVGRTIQEIQANVQAHIELREAKSGPINVRLIDWQSKKFYVLGEVNSPGSFHFDGDETVLDALIEAGGVGRNANAHQIILSRPTPDGSCREVFPICYHQIVQLGDASTNYQIQPGDRVFVPSLTFLDDLKASLMPGAEKPCPMCSGTPQGCGSDCEPK